MSEDEDACYVCLEASPPLVAPCADCLLKVHAGCLVDWQRCADVENARTHCPICRSRLQKPYVNPVDEGPAEAAAMSCSVRVCMLTAPLTVVTAVTVSVLQSSHPKNVHVLCAVCIAWMLAFCHSMFGVHIANSGSPKHLLVRSLTALAGTWLYSELPSVAIVVLSTFAFRFYAYDCMVLRM